MREKHWIKKLQKGSMTVETAAIMPLILLVIFAGLFFLLAFHNRTVLTGAACEAARSGSIAGAAPNGKSIESASLICSEAEKKGYFWASNLSSGTVKRGTKIVVSYDFDMLSIYGGIRWHMQVQGEAAVICPTERIRRESIAK